MTSFEEKVQNFSFFIGGVFCSNNHKIVMVSSKDINERCVLANDVK
jgi:hypothetical protein